MDYAALFLFGLASGLFIGNLWLFFRLQKISRGRFSSWEGLENFLDISTMPTKKFKHYDD